MKNSENQKFEENWKKVFLDAEATPADSVWKNIEVQLSRQESGAMKRSVIFYQRLAAASVIFALALSGGIWYSTRNNVQQVASIEVESKKTFDQKDGKAQQTTPAAQPMVNSSNENDVANGSKNKTENYTLASPSTKLNTQRTRNELKAQEAGTLNHEVIATSLPSQSNEQVDVAAKHDALPATHLLIQPVSKESSDGLLNQLTSAESKLKDEPESVFQPLLQPVPQPSEETSVTALFTEPMIAQAESKKKKTNSDEDWWASLGGTAGSYNPNTNTAMLRGSSSQNAYNMANATQQNNRSGVGTSYSFGMNFGKKIAPRLVLMSGFNYLTQSNEYNSNVAMLSSNNASFAADFLSLSSATAATTTTTPYTINSVNEFVSVPFQAGYLFIDRKVGLQLNAGMATDFFIKNTLADQSGKLLRYTQGAGDNSSYRTVNLTGLMGTELSYKVAKHYRVSVVPGLRYSFNSVLKSTTGSTINPMVWDVGFRFRYMF